MKISASFLSVLVTLVVSTVGLVHDGQPAFKARHIRTARGLGHTNQRRNCRAKLISNASSSVASVSATVSSSALPSSVTSSAPPPPPTTSSPPPPPPPPTTSSPPPPPPTTSSPPPPPSTTSAPPPPPPTSAPAPSPTNTASWLVSVISDGSCGPSGATTEITALSGPNGNINWLNCGITLDGWSPPVIHISGLVSVELSQVAWNSGSAFTACQPYVSIFEKYGQQYGIPAIMLASFAMQESTCNPNAVGGNGEQGLMQITPDKCGGAPNGNCQDPDFNIGTGASFFSQTLDSVNGDVLQAIGQYNGWYIGMTYADATAAASEGHCWAQNNLDYLHQFLNGWMQDIDAYTNNPPLGEYFNLADC